MRPSTTPRRLSTNKQDPSQQVNGPREGSSNRLGNELKRYGFKKCGG
jgi:hypothetical protein